MSSSDAAGAASSSSSSSRVPKLSADIAAKKSKEGWELFCDGAKKALWQWDLFKTAVIEEWGGFKSKDKYDHIVDDLLLNCKDQWDEGNDLHIDSLDVYLIECLTEDFNVDFEDDEVVSEVSRLIQDLYRKCVAGQYDDVRNAIAEMERAANRGSGSGAGAGGESTEPRQPRREKVIDEDGWETIVTRKGRKGAGAASGSGAAAGDEDDDGSDGDDDGSGSEMDED